MFIPLAYMEIPTLEYELFTLSGKRGWTGTWYVHENDESMTALNTPYSTRLVDKTRIFISISAPKGITRRWTMKLEGELKPRERNCLFELGLTVSGRAKVRYHIHVAIFSLNTDICSSSSMANLSLTTGHANAVVNPSSAAVLRKKRAACHLRPASNIAPSSSAVTSTHQQTVIKTTR
jgi:hypothetical protein